VAISQKALRIAQENALLHNAQINFMHGDLFNTPDLTPVTYDLIVCNPPYIPSREISRLQPEVRQEPRLALDGGSDGLDFYRRIAKDAPRYLKENGFLLLEIGHGQRDAIEDIMGFSGKIETAEVVKDYSNIDRILIFKRK
jgi:release factor glutamine methyltransferase